MGKKSTGNDGKLRRKEYERQLRILHAELVAMQEWVKTTGAKVCIVFEGRDTAGKGGTIKAITAKSTRRAKRTRVRVRRYLRGGI